MNENYLPITEKITFYYIKDLDHQFTGYGYWIRISDTSLRFLTCEATKQHINSTIPQSTWPQSHQIRAVVIKKNG